MELSDKDKERILAEEKYRMEAQGQIHQARWGGWGYGCSRWGFGKGLLVGIILSVLVGFAFHHHHRPYGHHYGQGCGQYNQGTCHMGPGGPQPFTRGMDDKK